MNRTGNAQSFLRRHRSTVTLLAAFATALGAACGVNVDKILEGKQPTTDRITLRGPGSVTIPQGATDSVTIVAIRTHGFQGSMQLVTADIPRDVDAPQTLPPGTTSGDTTTTTLKLSVAGNVPVAEYAIRVISKALPVPDTSVTIYLNVTPQPAYVLVPGATSVTVAPGGHAPLSLAIARTNFTDSVSFSLVGTTGISATFTRSGPDSATALISVSASLPPGTYSDTLRGAAPPLANRVVPITVKVVDAIQLIAPAQVSASPNSSVTTKLIVNRGSYAGPLTVTAENVPSGVTVTPDPVGTGDVSIAIKVDASVAQGTYPVTLRAKGTGIPDATTQFSLTVDAPPLSAALLPSTVTVLPGTKATTTLLLARRSYSGTVAITFGNAPSGISATAQPATVSDTTSSIEVTASSAVAPGQYSLTVTATPSGLPAGAARSATLTVLVRSSSPGAGNVTVDASTCLPDWFAFQESASTWTQVLPTAGRFQFTVSSATGGFAYHDSSGVTVRYMTQAELTRGTINICPRPLGTKSIIGRGNLATGNGSAPAGEYRFSLGDAQAVATAASPAFTLTNVKDGPQDLVVVYVNLTPVGPAMLQRDLDLPNGSNLGDLSLNNGAGIFILASGAVTIPGLSLDMPHSMDYLTTPACILNPLYSTTTGNILRGVPASLQRPTDYHLLRVFTNTPVAGAIVARTSGLSFHSFGNQTLALPPSVAMPSVTALGGLTKRLSASIPELSSAYGDSTTFKFSYGGRKMTVWATSAVLGTANATLAMPDLTGVSGWPASAQIPTNVPVDWALTLDGSSAAESLCTEGHKTSQFKVTASTP